MIKGHNVLGDPLPDLTACDREPIHCPGSIQPHGILFAASYDRLRISAISANASAYCGTPALALLDAPLSSVLSEESGAALALALRRPAGEALRMASMRLSASPAVSWRGVLHVDIHGLFLEAELVPDDADSAARDQFECFQAASERLMSARETASIHACLVQEIRRLTGYARVMLYRFAPDWSGEVIAESSEGGEAAYLGLHFPASDIPVQARALYACNPERQIPDAAYDPIPVLHGGHTPLDLGRIGLRSVSPIHCAYLHNMGVRASMSVSVMQNGQLWGLVACHHPEPRRTAPEVRQSCVLLAQLAVARFSLVEEADAALRNVTVKTQEVALLGQAADGEDIHCLLLRGGRALLEMMDASGVVLSSGGRVTSVGKTPPEATLEGLMAWLATRNADQWAGEMLVTDNLARLYGAHGPLPDAAGLLAVPLGGYAADIIVWFRQEVARAVTWAGNPQKSAEAAAGLPILSPRRSFAAWHEQVRGHARPWTRNDIATACSLRDTLAAITLRRAAETQRMNAELLRTNQELDSFAYVASHDLKEPLRQIEVFGSLLRRAFSREGDPAEKIERWFDGISSSSRRLRALIDHLAEFARLGGEARAFAPANLDSLLAGVLQDHAAALDEASATIDADRLPSLMCDAVQMRQVLQNLVSNAIKYRHPQRPLMLRIGMAVDPPPEAQPAGATAAIELPNLELRFEDNGIGFDARHVERIFKPFERLHSAEEYEGSGLGLAICRKIVERHGGCITAVSREGDGSTFTVSLPMRPPGGLEGRLA